MRRGITLLELLLVLALLAVIASLATPAIFGSFSSVRLRRAADGVLASWSQARLRAIEEGLPQEFRFEQDSQDYRTRPSVAQSAGDRGNLASHDDDARLQASKGDEYLQDRRLPDGVSFYRLVFAEKRQASQRDANDRTEQGWSAPIWFYPDGTAETVALLLTNDRKQYVQLSLRGLTGVGRVSDVLTADEISRQATSP